LLAIVVRVIATDELGFLVTRWFLEFNVVRTKLWVPIGDYRDKKERFSVIPVDLSGNQWQSD